MNPRNPIDDLFRQRLENYETEVPEYLWGGIDSRRGRRHRYLLFGQRHWPLLLAVVIGLSGLLSLALWPQSTPPLRSFPVPVAAKDTPLAAMSVRAPLPALRQVAAVRSGTPSPPVEASATIVARARLTSTAVNPPAAPSEEKPDRNLFPVALQEKSGSAAIPMLPKIAAVPFARGPQCVRFGENRRWRLYADMSLGPAYAIRQLEAKSSEFEDYAAARRDTERPQVSFTTGVRLSLVTDFGLALRTGLQYTQFNEKFDYTDNSEETITITNVYGPNGEIIGTDTLVETTMQRQIAYNNYRMVDIPLLVGYEWRRPKWTLAFNGGPLINVLFRARGDFLSPDDMSPVDFSSDATGTYPAFRREIGLGWYAGIGFHYKVREDIQILLEPHFRLYPGSVTRNDYVLDQKYMNAGLSVGLRKQL